MRNTKEVPYEKLKYSCDPSSFNFTTTKDLQSNYKGVGQERGISSLEFGLSIDTRGYNLYLEGPTGSGKTTYTKNYLDKISKKRKTPNDWCYIYNFDNPNEPVAVNLTAGEGNKFKDMMENFIRDIRRELKSTFKTDNVEKQKKQISQKYQNQKNKLINDLNKKSARYNFEVKSSDNGIFMMPMVNGVAIKEEEFDQLDPKIKEDYEKKSEIVQELIMEAIASIKEIESLSENEINEWKSSIAVITIDNKMSDLKVEFKRNNKIKKFLEGLKNDIIKNIDAFTDEDKKENAENNGQPKALEIKPWDNYRVNVFVDNSNIEGAPAIMDSNYSFNNLFGRLEYENYYGMLKTDHTMLRPGLLQKANGGYLVLQANDLMSNPVCYENLKRVLRNHEISIDNSLEQKQSSMVLVSLKPEAIPLNLKVILIGDENVYQTLLSVDEEFKKLFKIKVEFEDFAPVDNKNLTDFARFIHSYCADNDIPHLDRKACARLAEYASRIAEDQTKLSTQFGDMTQVIAEAANWAQQDGADVVTDVHIRKALVERKKRTIKYDEKYNEMIANGDLMIDTDGAKVGQINGLSVMTIGEYSFGKPVRITANTYCGKQGIINIEREADLAGPTQQKGALIMQGYLGQKFAQEMILSLNASICFEQLYSEIDGDSASSTELYAILSALSNIPINQSIAVTGSVNQKGEIQVIGGVNEKIEGFFAICKERGLTGNQGVMIPAKNVRNLNLDEEIIEAVKENKFHIYAVSTIEEGIEILTGVPAGNIDVPGTINYLAYKQLQKYSNVAKESK